MNNEAFSSRLSRRAFARTVALTTGAATFGKLALPVQSAEPGVKKTSAAIIGHTGKGDYGHGLDVIFNGRGQIQIVGIADPVPSGRAKAAGRCQAMREYDDYRLMLEKEKPRLVCIAPRWTDQHHAMAMAALNIGAHLYLEKPITQNLAEADELLAKADQAGLKLAVSHQM